MGKDIAASWPDPRGGVSVVRLAYIIFRLVGSVGLTFLIVTDAKVLRWTENQRANDSAVSGDSVQISFFTKNNILTAILSEDRR